MQQALVALQVVLRKVLLDVVHELARFPHVRPVVNGHGKRQGLVHVGVRTAAVYGRGEGLLLAIVLVGQGDCVLNLAAVSFPLYQSLARVKQPPDLVRVLLLAPRGDVHGDLLSGPNVPLQGLAQLRPPRADEDDHARHLAVRIDHGEADAALVLTVVPSRHGESNYWPLQLLSVGGLDVLVHGPLDVVAVVRGDGNGHLSLVLSRPLVLGHALLPGVQDVLVQGEV
mmetsp:Transcript_4171/g.14585  ORF Transcript_4171/g.14585 Transcript_4171/m.14585 type:complete len:227 (+) Transcript_4171:611-1291(+)